MSLLLHVDWAPECAWDCDSAPFVVVNTLVLSAQRVTQFDNKCSWRWLQMSPQSSFYSPCSTVLRTKAKARVWLKPLRAVLEGFYLFFSRQEPFQLLHKQGTTLGSDYSEVPLHQVPCRGLWEAEVGIPGSDHSWGFLALITALRTGNRSSPCLFGSRKTLWLREIGALVSWHQLAIAIE